MRKLMFLCVSLSSLSRSPFHPLNSYSAAWLTSWPREGKSSTSLGGSSVLQLGLHASFTSFLLSGRAHNYPLNTHTHTHTHIPRPNRLGQKQRNKQFLFLWKIYISLSLSHSFSRISTSLSLFLQFFSVFLMLHVGYLSIIMNLQIVLLLHCD